MDSYQPIACGAYDALEALALKRKTTVVHWTADGKNVSTGVIDTFLVKDRAEYMRLVDLQEQMIDIRVDRILEIQSTAGDLLWSQSDK